MYVGTEGGEREREEKKRERKERERERKRERGRETEGAGANDKLATRQQKGCKVPTMVIAVHTTDQTSHGN